MKKFTHLLLLIFTLQSFTLLAQRENSLPHGMTADELERRDEIGRDFFETDPPEGEVRAIAEFEPMESVLIRYPLGIPLDLVAIMSEEILVSTIVSGPYQENNAIEDFENAGVNMDNVTFIHAPTDSYWTRDYGPWYIEYGDNQIGVVNFPYNRPRPNDNDIPIVIADSLDLELFGMNLVHTGGNYMATGINQGASTTLVIDENDYTIEEMDQLTLDYLGIGQYHYNEDPLGEYIEHIDCWGKFLDVDKVIIGQVPESDYRYEDFEAVADYYENTLSDWGNTYEVYRVFTPGDYPNTPYTNSLILNDRVFVPVTGSQYDDEALESWEAAMPGYEIIGIDYYSWENTDALHCRTHEMADRFMLKINHMPTLGDVERLEEYPVEAEIEAFSGEALYADSVKLYYRFEDGMGYEHSVMTNTTGDMYTASIPVPESINEVQYFIHAADESGRSENHPYIGAPDPHVFFPAPAAVADIQLDTEAIETTAMVDLSAQETVTITNAGEQELSYTIDFTFNEGDGWAYTTSPNGIIAPGNSSEITITFNADDMAIDTYTGTMTINSNDPDEGVVDIPLTFNVTVNTSVDGVSSGQPAVYPNPFTQKLTIDISVLNEKAEQIKIYDIKGKLVKTYSGNAIKNSIIWNSTVSNGIYFIRIETATENHNLKVTKK